MTDEQPVESSRGAIASFRSVWAHKRWRWLLGSTVVSLAGDFLYWVAIAVYFVANDDAVFWLAASLIARMVPYVVLGPFGGAIADRFDRRSLMVRLDLARGALFVVMAAVVVVDGPPVFVIMLLTLISTATAVYNPARIAAIPQLVPENDIAAANAGEQGLGQLSWFVGPAIGAVLVTVLDPSIVLMINAASFVVSALMVARIGNVGGAAATPGGTTGATAAATTSATAPGNGMPTPAVSDSAPADSALADSPLADSVRADSEPAESMWSSLLSDVRASARIVRQSRGLSGVTLMGVAASLAFGAEQVLYVLVASDRLDLGAEGIGYLLAAMGVGGLIATPISARAGNSSRSGVWILGSGMLVTLPLVLIALTDSLIIVLALAVVEGGAAIVFEVLMMTLLQRAVDESMMGRIFSAIDAVGALGQAIGSMGAPILVSIVGLTAAMQVSGGVAIVLMVVLAPAVLALSRTTETTRLRHRATAAWLNEIPELASFETVELERLARSSVDLHVEPGDVVIREGDAPDFLYVVRSGALTVHKASPVASDQSSGGLGPNDLFGEIGLIRNIPRTATVTALDATDLLRIDGSVFTSIATPNAAATAPLLGRMRTRLPYSEQHAASDDDLPPGPDVEPMTSSI